ncbi:RRM domain-containing protein [Entamoeba marina]
MDNDNVLFNEWLKMNKVEVGDWKCELDMFMKNINTLHSTIDNLIEQKITDGIEVLNETVNSYETILQSTQDELQQNLTQQFDISTQLQQHKIQNTIQTNVQTYNTYVNSLVTKYSDASDKLQHFAKISSDVNTMKSYDKFKELYNKWDPVSHKLAFGYIEHYGVLEESQKQLTGCLEDWEKTVNMRSHVIQAVHSNLPRRITVIFDGHEKDVLKLKLSVTLLMRLVRCLSSSLTYDADNRVDIISKFITTLLKRIREDLETVTLTRKQELLLLLSSIEEIYQNDEIQPEQVLTPKPKEGYCVMIDGIPKEANYDAVIGLFKRIGKVLNTIEIDEGKCEVQYQDFDAALNACKLNKRLIKNTNSILSVHLIQ